MKTDLNTMLNKLISYARENLMLDALDEVYTLNRLATALGVKTPEKSDIDVDDETPDALFSELKAACPGADLAAVADILMPAAHTVDYYFGDELARNPQKAFDFLFDLYIKAGSINNAPAYTADGCTFYADAPTTPRPVMLDVGEPLPYTISATADRIASLACPDIITSDIVSRLGAYAAAYGGTIAKRIGADGDYMCCGETALSSAKAKATIADGPVKVALLDYPVPAVSVSGLAKNSVEREVTKAIKSAAEKDIALVAACAKEKSGVVFYLVFANDIQATDIIKDSGALAACGVFKTVDFSPLLPVLEKGTALSTDLAAFKGVYAGIGGVKHGAKATAVLAGAVVKLFKSALEAASSATTDEATALFGD